MAQLNEIPRLCDWMTQRGETNILEEAACVEFVHSRASRVRINQAKLRLGFGQIGWNVASVDSKTTLSMYRIRRVKYNEFSSFEMMF